MVGCGLTSATWLPLTMRLPPSTPPSGSRERRSFAFIREDSGIAQRPRRICSITSRIVLEHRRCLRGDGSTRPPTPSSSSAILEAVLDLCRGTAGGTESRNQEDLGGPGRTRSKQQSNMSGHLRSREDTGGHVTNTVRDREAPGSNPGPPTNPYARVARNALTLVVCGSSSSCLYRDDSTAISAILPARLL